MIWQVILVSVTVVVNDCLWSMAGWCDIFQSIHEGMIKINTFCPSLTVFDGSPVAFGSQLTLRVSERERERGGGEREREVEGEEAGGRADDC